MKAKRMTTAREFPSGHGASQDRGLGHLRFGIGCGLALAVASGLLLRQHLTDASSSPAELLQSTPPKTGVWDEPVAYVTEAKIRAPGISSVSHGYVERLVQANGSGGMTTGAALAWDESRVQLIGLGVRAIPAIREFLSKNSSDRWDAGARHVLGYESARVAMFDALRRIGGPEAEAALASTLAETSVPREIALLVRDLEMMAPGQYREVAVDAVRRSFASEPHQSSSPRDVAPLFEVLNRFGGIAVISDLEEVAARWSHYAAMSLAHVPDGAGIPSLIRLAGDFNAGATSDPAIRMLGSVAAHNEAARGALLELTKNNRIAPSTWMQLGPILAGAQLQFVGGVFEADIPLDYGADAQRIHVNEGNQNFWLGMPAVTVRAEQWERQLVWLDQLSAVATAPAAQAAIQEAWKLIIARLNPQIAGVR